MFDSLTSIAAGLFMIGVLVVVHEAGHFFFARLFGVGVPIFSVGVGPRLFGYVWRGTDYRVSALPLGGYVLMSGADPFGEEDAGSDVPPEQDFMRKPVWQRLVIMAAGPGVNLALPFFVFTVLYMLGKPDVGPVVGAVFPGSAAEQAGLLPQDRVLAVDGEPVEIWHDVEDALQERLADGAKAPMVLEIERAGQPQRMELPAGAVTADAHGEVDAFRFGAVPYDLPTQVGTAIPGSPAANAGLTLGDYVLKVDGEEVRGWRTMLAALQGERHALHVGRFVDDEIVYRDVVIERTPPVAEPEGGPYTNAWGLQPAQLFVVDVSEDGPAAKAGIRKGDRLLTVDGKPIFTFDHLRTLVAWSSPDGADPRPVQLRILRDGAPSELTLTPKFTLVEGEPYARPIIGITSYGDLVSVVPFERKYYSLFEALPRAVAETNDVIERTVATLGNLLTLQADIRKNLGGPVAIFYAAGVQAERGFFEYASLIGMISVSLGIFNLLPVPVLDGGQILFYLVEVVRGRPLTLEVRERLQMVGVIAMMLLMAFVIIEDFRKVLGG
jgi:regulator of sigma E protease